MQVTETLNDGLKRGYEITVPGSELDEKVTQKLQEAQPEVQMKGFRKGKVPLPLLKKQFGPRLMGEAMQETVDGAMSKHFEETGDRPALQPDVKMTNEDWKEGDDIVVSMTYEKLPDIPEVDFGDVELETLKVAATDEAVDEALASLAETAQTFEAKEGAAEDGDQVVIDFKGFVDGEPFEGGEAEDYPLTLGSNSFIPGFEEQLVGATAGEDREVNVSFPEDYQAEHLAGKEARFEVAVKEVKKPAKAEVDDELAKRFGADDLDALKTQIRERLEAEYVGAARQVTKRRLLDALDGKVDFDLPPSLEEAEAKQIAHQLWHEEHPEVQGHDHGEIEVTDEHRKLAGRRVRLGLLLAEVGRKAEIQVSDAEMTQAVMNQARQYPGQERQFFEFVQQNAQARQQIQAPLFEDKVVDYVLELAKVDEKEVSKEELQEAMESLEDA
ncbi:trigger factor [Hasllibacter halocynthiae]|uniref:Trigger factor n=1 Tax=Hasllibacter halocynthiae TaxID=595589 RepID=A0A2T0X8W8_9RHOB|nr:trigger factor [Hasllibacter halocynthiae]PRY95391.1 trigger factor [Hasllibacter halocynthiae]